MINDILSINIKYYCDIKGYLLQNQDEKFTYKTKYFYLKNYIFIKYKKSIPIYLY